MVGTVPDDEQTDVKGGCGAVRSVSLQHVPWAGDVRSSAVRVIGAGEGAACPQRYEGC